MILPNRFLPAETRFWLDELLAHAENVVTECDNPDARAMADMILSKFSVLSEIEELAFLLDMRLRAAISNWMSMGSLSPINYMRQLQKISSLLCRRLGE